MDLKFFSLIFHGYLINPNYGKIYQGGCQKLKKGIYFFTENATLYLSTTFESKILFFVVYCGERID